MGQDSNPASDPAGWESCLTTDNGQEDCMSRTMLCVLTAGVLASVSLGTSLVRRHVLGEETRVPHDPGTYRVALHVSAQSTGDARLMTACPLGFGGQHGVGEETSSDTLSAKTIESRHGGRRHNQGSLSPRGA